MFFTTNELRKGDRIQLRNGWFGTIKDNKKGDTRLAEVEGLFTEIGSVYSHDIAWYVEATGEKIAVVHTPKQLKLRALVEKF